MDRKGRALPNWEARGYVGGKPGVPALMHSFAVEPTSQDSDPNSDQAVQTLSPQDS